VFFQKKQRSHERFYLFPGQGGRNQYLKQRRFFCWAVVVALVFGTILAVILWRLSGPRF
jgi:hypothetical protein